VKHKREKTPWQWGIGNPFRLDYNSLAIFRIGFGLVLLYDTLIRWADLSAHYTDNGLLSVEQAVSRVDFSFSFHTLTGEWWWILFLFIVQTIAAIFMIVGFRTKIVVALLWVLTVSLQNRNDLILNAGDLMVRVVLFWSIFLPLAQRLSVDLVQGRIKLDARPNYFSPVTVAFMFQIAIIYLQTGLMKTGIHWRGTNEALYIALNAEQFSNPLGVWASQFRGLMELLTWLAVRLEDWVALLILNPIKNGFTRSFGAIALIGFHGSLIILMSIGHFPLVGVVTAIALLPTVFWDQMGMWLRRWRRPNKKLTVYYDQKCGLCQKFVRYLIVFLSAKNIEYKSVYKYKTILAKSNKRNSWVAVSSRKYFYREKVFIEVVARSSYLFWLAPLLRWRPISTFANKIYHWVSTRRHSVCLPAGPPKKWYVWRNRVYKLGGWAGGVIVIAVLAAVIVWTTADLPGVTWQVSGKPRQVMNYLRMDQLWNMFSPNPLSSNGWYIVKAQINDVEYDLWRPFYDGKDQILADYDRPDHMYDTYVNQRWRRYLTRLQENGYQAERTNFLKYMCQEWKINQPNLPLEEIELIYMEEITLLDPTQEEIVPKFHGRIDCSAIPEK